MKYEQSIFNLTNAENDPKVRRPDISRAKKLLKWQPKVNVEDGLLKTIEWFRNK